MSPLQSAFLAILACASIGAAQDSAGTPNTATSKTASGLKRVAKIPTVAVLEFTSPGNVVPAADLQAITSRFESEIIASDSFRVVERRNIGKILREQGFQQSGACENAECQVEVGQLLGVQSLLTGEVGLIDGAWSLAVKRTDVGTGQTVFSHVIDIKGSKVDVLRGGVTRMARIATGQEMPEKERTVLVADKPIWPWIVGGTALVGGGVAAAVLLTGNSTAPAATAAPSTNYNAEVQWKTK